MGLSRAALYSRLLTLHHICVMPASVSIRILVRSRGEGRAFCSTRKQLSASAFTAGT